MKTTISRAAGPTLYTLEHYPSKKNYRAIYSLLAENTERREEHTGSER